jgi:hypothetical protein
VKRSLTVYSLRKLESEAQRALDRLYDRMCETCGWNEREPPAACVRPNCELYYRIKERRRELKQQLGGLVNG